MEAATGQTVVLSYVYKKHSIYLIQNNFHTLSSWTAFLIRRYSSSL